VIDIIKVIILGIIEGLTEFLPISSTGHLIVASTLLQFDVLGGTFEIFIQLGAVIAIIIFYLQDILKQVRSVPSDRQTQHFWLCIIIAFIPAAAIGFLFSDAIDAFLFNPTVVGIALIVGGIVFLIVERRPAQSQPQTEEVTAVTLRQALAVGIIQTVALIPGVSRSGASIIGGMLFGMSRQAATTFSFYLAIPTLGAATIYSLLRNLDAVSSDNLFLLILGTVISGVVAWLSVAWLLRYISRNNFIAFGYYRIFAGALILLLVALGVFSPSNP
jgi:undecaprenyl-diphosphatase